MRRSKAELLHRLCVRFVKGEIDEPTFLKRIDNESYYTKKDFKGFLVEHCRKSRRKREECV